MPFALGMITSCLAQGDDGMIELGDKVVADWHWQPVVLLLLSGLAVLYGRGWHRYRLVGFVLPLWRPLTFVSGLFLLFLALVSPLYDLALSYLFARVSQHILLLAPAPALLLVGDPWPILKAGLPERWRAGLTRHFGEGTRNRGRIQQFTPIGGIWIGFIASFSLWYDPALHAAALRLPWLRTLELLTMFMGASLYWWIVTQASPRLHTLPNFWLRVLLAAIGASPLKILGGLLMFSETAIYSYPANAIVVMDVSGVRAQQLLGGVVVWFLGGITFTNAAFWLIRDWLHREEEKPLLSISAISTHERMIAPGWEGDRY